MKIITIVFIAFLHFSLLSAAPAPPSSEIGNANLPEADSKIELPRCPICLENIDSPDQISAMTKSVGRKRTCQHFLCKECAPQILENKNECPVCRIQIDGIETFNPKDNQQLFRLFDIDGNGEITKSEIEKNIRLLIPCYDGDIDKLVDENWKQAKKQESGSLNFLNFSRFCNRVLDRKPLTNTVGLPAVKEWFQTFDLAVLPFIPKESIPAVIRNAAINNDLEAVSILLELGADPKLLEYPLKRALWLGLKNEVTQLTDLLGDLKPVKIFRIH